jgi:F-type H+-transporting ATPase subunit c
MGVITCFLSITNHHVTFRIISRIFTSFYIHSFVGSIYWVGNARRNSLINIINMEQAVVSYAPIGLGLIVIGIGLGIGTIGRGAMEAIGRQPEATSMIIAAALIEGAGLLAIIFAWM